MKQIIRFLPSVALLILIGCAPIDSAVYDSTKRQATTDLDIYKDGQMPDRKYKVIAEISMPGHRDNELLRQGQIVERAKHMGGQGLLFFVEPAGVNVLGGSEWLFKGKVIVYQ